MKNRSFVIRKINYNFLFLADFRTNPKKKHRQLEHIDNKAQSVRNNPAPKGEQDIRQSQRPPGEVPPPPRRPGLKKKKIRQRPRDEDYIPPPPPPEEDDDDVKVVSFMVEPGKAKPETGGESGSSEYLDEPVVKRVEYNSTPQFGERLNVAFTPANSRNRRNRKKKKKKKLKKKKMDAEPTETEVPPKEEPVKMEVIKEPEPAITDVDEDSYISWDGGMTGEASRPLTTNGSEIETADKHNKPPKEVFCRNCKEQILRKYIKYYLKTQGDETVKVEGPFCSKLCSLEFSE